MDLNDLVLVSVDDHIVEPPGMFEGRLPARLKDQAPRVLKVGEDDVWEFDGKRNAYVGLNAVVGRPLMSGASNPLPTGSSKGKKEHYVKMDRIFAQ